MKLSRLFRGAASLAAVGLLAAAMLVPSSVGAASTTGAIWTTYPDGTTVNANTSYTSKQQVYLNGGPQNCGSGGGLDDGDYYFQVTDPSGATLLSSDAIKFRQIQVVNGVISGVSGSGNHAVGPATCTGGQGVQLYPYDDTPNNGDEYSVDIAKVADVQACSGFSADSLFNFKGCTSTKNDNFKVAAESASPSPSPSASESASPSPSPSASESASPSPSPTGSVAAETSSPSASESPSPTGSVAAETSSPSDGASPVGSVLSETATPVGTLPATDSTGSTGGASGNGLPLVLAAVSILLLAVLVVTPSRKRTRG